MVFLLVVFHPLAMKGISRIGFEQYPYLKNLRKNVIVSVQLSWLGSIKLCVAKLGIDVNFLLFRGREISAYLRAALKSCPPKYV